jgi:hypothetical protein
VFILITFSIDQNVTYLRVKIKSVSEIWVVLYTHIKKEQNNRYSEKCVWIQFLRFIAKAFALFYFHFFLCSSKIWCISLTLLLIVALSHSWMSSLSLYTKWISVSTIFYGDCTFFVSMPFRFVTFFSLKKFPFCAKNFTDRKQTHWRIRIEGRRDVIFVS